MNYRLQPSIPESWKDTHMVVTLYRPIGLFELRLIAASGYRAFPPRLPTQPIFYPVLNRDYAVQIARDWNTVDTQSGYLGAITAFDLPQAYLQTFSVQTVGASLHQELWIPAEQLDDFNQRIIGLIRLVDVFYGKRYQGEPISM
jgi:hypothetical protein